MSTQDQAYVRTDLQSGLLTIEFYTPAHNSLPSHILAELAETITSASTDDAVRLIVLKSAGNRTYCAGASFDELVAIENEEQGESFFMGFANVINAIRKCSKLVIGRVQGKAVGGGVGLASAVDYCVATKFAAIRLSELAVGIGPFVIGPPVSRKVGVSAFSQMAVTPNEWQSAEWALNKGLYFKVFDDAAAMDAFIDSFTGELLSMNPEALAGLKSIFWEGTEDWDDLLHARAMMSGRLVLSKFSKDSISKFLAK